MFNLEGKCALITGATGGIGRAVVKTLHAQGATVVLTDRGGEEAKKIVDELGCRAFTVTGNLSQAEDIERIVKEAEDLVGKIDILVNNAGLTRDSLAVRMKEEDWDLVLNVNLKACFMLSKAILMGMMKRRYGKIVNMASVVGYTGNAGQANYSASKGGLVAMSKTMAQEVASRNITINCVAPGFIMTPMTEVLSEDQKQKLAQNIPMGKLGTPQDVANAVLFLASDESAYITGQTVHVNGGMAMF